MHCFSYPTDHRAVEMMILRSKMVACSTLLESDNWDRLDVQAIWIGSTTYITKKIWSRLVAKWAVVQRPVDLSMQMGVLLGFVGDGYHPQWKSPWSKPKPTQADLFELESVGEGLISSEHLAGPGKSPVNTWWILKTPLDKWNIYM